MLGNKDAFYMAVATWLLGYRRILFCLGIEMQTLDEIVQKASALCYDNSRQFSDIIEAAIIEYSYDLSTRLADSEKALREAQARIAVLEVDGPMVDGGVQIEVDADDRPVGSWRPRRICMRQALEEAELVAGLEAPGAKSHD